MAQVEQKLNQEDMWDIPIPVPCLCEQERIADYITVIDCSINYNMRQLETLQDLKTACCNSSSYKELLYKSEFGRRDGLKHSYLRNMKVNQPKCSPIRFCSASLLELYLDIRYIIPADCSKCSSLFNGFPRRLKIKK